MDETYTDRVRRTMRDLQDVEDACGPISTIGGLVLIVKRGDRVIKSKALQDFAETKIVTHAGKITFIESTVKEKVE